MGSGAGNIYRETYGSWEGAESDGGHFDRPEDARLSRDTRCAGLSERLAANERMAAERFRLNAYGHFGRRSRGARIIESEDPYADSQQLFDCLSKGSQIEPLGDKSGTGIRGTFPDDTMITRREITKTLDSPAVEVRRSGFPTIKNQKIHFVKGRP